MNTKGKYICIYIFQVAMFLKMGVYIYMYIYVSLLSETYFKTNISITILLLLLFIFLYFSRAWMKITLCTSILPCLNKVLLLLFQGHIHACAFCFTEVCLASTFSHFPGRWSVARLPWRPLNC